MVLNGKEINVEDIVKDVYNDNDIIKMRGNGIYLSNNQVEVLRKYNIDYEKYNSLNSLIFEIEEILNEETDLDDLEEISQKLSELNYYNNTNK